MKKINMFVKRFQFKIRIILWESNGHAYLVQFYNKRPFIPLTRDRGNG